MVVMKHSLSEKTLPDFLKSRQFRGIPGALNNEPSMLFKIVVRILSPNIKFDDEAVKLLRRLSEDGPVVYALKYPSYYDLQYIRMRLASLGLPAPCFLLGGAANLRNLFSRVAGLFKPKSGSRLTPEIVRGLLVNKCAGAFFLVDENDSRNRYVSPEQDPVNVLIEAQSKMPEPIAIVPIFPLYDRRQKRQIQPFWETLLGNPDRPGCIRRILTAFRKWTQPELLVGCPVHLIAEYEEFGSDKSWEDLPFEVRRELIENINDRIRVNRGPEKLSRMEVEERVLQDARVQKAVSESAKSDRTTEENTRRKAQSYVNEIAADQRIQTIHFLYYALNWLFKRILDKLDYLESDFTSLKKANEKNSLIFVSCHKSHLDYLVVGYILFTNQMPLPLMAAGKNLSFWPVGHVLRKGGAFFIRRSFKGLILYTRVFASYVQVLIKEKININFYIEGGRSRTGKFLHPKVGMLGFLLDTVFEGAVDDLTFVPTFAGYDRVPEEKSYLQELGGREKQKESFFSFLKSRKILKTKFGAAYVRFHQPITFRDFAFRVGVDRPLKELASAERRDLVENFAFYLMTRITAVSVITLPDLAAAALVSHNSSVVERSAFEEAIDAFSKGLRYLGIEISGNQKDLLNGCQQALEGFFSRKFLETESNSENQSLRYVLNENRRSNLEFYKNSLVNCLWAPALLATALLEQNSLESIPAQSVIGKFQNLKELLNREFIFDPLIMETEIVENCAKLFENYGWLNFNRATDLFEVKFSGALKIYQGLIHDILGVYKTCMAALAQIGDETMSERDFIGLATKMSSGLKILPSGRNVTLSAVTVRNALIELTRLKIAEYNQTRKKVRRGKVDPASVFELR